MADTQEAPQTATQPIPAPGGSIAEAHEALLGIMDSDGEIPLEKATAEKAEPTEVEESQPEEEDESLEVESEEEEEEEEVEASEDTDESEEEVEDLYAVTVNGEEQAIPLDELLKGYSRQSDYTKKTQELSEQRREMDTLREQWTSEVSRIQAERQHYIQSLESAVQSSIGHLDQFANIDWNKLKEENPLEFITKRDEYREAESHIQQYKAQQAQAAQVHEATEKEAHARLVHEESGKLVGVLPEWGETAKRKALGEELKAYAISEGYTAEEIKGLVDHRNFMTLYKAMKYDKASSPAVVKKKVKNKPRVIRAGRGTVKEDRVKSARAASMKRLQQTGRVDDATALLEEFVDI